VQAALGPVDAAVGGATSSVGGALASVGDLTDRSELSDLREENERLRRELAEGEQAERRVAELDALLGVVAEQTAVPARVVGAGSRLGFGRTVTIDAGSDDGLREDLTVVAAAGLVGRTVEVGPSTSVVLLLDDPGFGVGARLARAGTLGLARGDGSGSLLYTQVEGGSVEPDEVLLTTGSDTFVPDVAIGRVTSVRSTAGGLTSVAEVEPLVDTGRLDLVAVVTESPRGTPRSPLPGIS
jgi:rod shape-determining protein MreC